MQIKSIIKEAKKYDLTEIEYAAVLLYYHTENRRYSYEYTIAIGKKCKNTSINTLANNFFNSVKVVKMLNDLVGEDKKESEEEKQSEDKLSNKRNQIELTSNMSQDDLILFFKQEMRGITDRKTRSELSLKLLDKLNLAEKIENNDIEKPIAYLPLRCEQCEYKPK